ncbi:hypothetical protein F7725_001327 [Dissostichus mawsoni]|uniref:Uncharacterized protein n=1 Tax=Dissostichus mawsoni TaxID=36200 RepID=A0A7J5ZGX6_DISMA|nr:hypothetical protein F7725_001327 [Dissostichus mawsoni]
MPRSFPDFDLEKISAGRSHTAPEKSTQRIYFSPPSARRVHQAQLKHNPESVTSISPWCSNLSDDMKEMTAGWRSDRKVQYQDVDVACSGTQTTKKPKMVSVALQTEGVVSVRSPTRGLSSSLSPTDRTTSPPRWMESREESDPPHRPLRRNSTGDTLHPECLLLPTPHLLRPEIEACGARTRKATPASQDEDRVEKPGEDPNEASSHRLAAQERQRDPDRQPEVYEAARREKNKRRVRTNCRDRDSPAIERRCRLNEKHGHFWKTESGKEN